MDDIRAEIVEILENWDMPTHDIAVTDLLALLEKKIREAHGLHIKGIEDYQKFKDSEDEYERTVAWINQLSHWNLERGIEHLKWRFKIREQLKDSKASKQ